MPPICRARSTGSGLSACRRENASSWRVSPAPRCGGLAHAVHEALAPRRVGLPVQHLEAAGDHHQQIVEVVRHAAGELPDRLDLLRLPQRLLDPGPFRHLPVQLDGSPPRAPGCGRPRGPPAPGPPARGPPAGRGPRYCRWRARTAAWIVLVSVIACTGRSSSETLRSAATRRWRQAATAGCSWRLVSTTNGRSDQAGWPSTQATRAADPCRTAPPRRRTPPPPRRRCASTRLGSRADRSRPQRRCGGAGPPRRTPSRPIGAKTRTRGRRLQLTVGVIDRP